MEETEIKEVSVERIAEEVQAEVEREARASWKRWLALSTALFAVLAAIASLKSGNLANRALLEMDEAVLKQTQAADEWAYYQAKGIKSTVRESEVELLALVPTGTASAERAQSEASRLRAEQAEIEREARRLEDERTLLQHEAEQNLERHHRFALVVTVLQVSIGLAAIAALVERRFVWYGALIIGAVGLALFVIGFLR